MSIAPHLPVMKNKASFQGRDASLRFAPLVMQGERGLVRGLAARRADR